MNLNVAVVGAGSWGTTVANLAAANAPTVLWSRNSESAEEINEHHTPGRYLGDYTLRPELAATDDLTPLLQAIDSFGIGLARRLPTEPGQVLDFAGRIGFVRETNYGRLFDVIVEPDPINLAFSPLGLPLHTDNPYRDPVPTVQLLHCLSAATTGGGSRFADGFAAAERLREEDPAAFESLATHDVAFRFHDDTTDLRARGTIIETTARGELTGIRLNHRSMEPPDMSTDVLDEDLDPDLGWRDPSEEARQRTRPEMDQFAPNLQIQKSDRDNSPGGMRQN